MSQVVITGYDIEIRRRLKTWIGDMMSPKLFLVCCLVFLE